MNSKQKLNRVTYSCGHSEILPHDPGIGRVICCVKCGMKNVTVTELRKLGINDYFEVVDNVEED